MSMTPEYFRAAALAPMYKGHFIQSNGPLPPGVELNIDGPPRDMSNSPILVPLTMLSDGFDFPPLNNPPTQSLASPRVSPTTCTPCTAAPAAPLTASRQPEVAAHPATTADAPMTTAQVPPETTTQAPPATGAAAAAPSACMPEGSVRLAGLFKE